jgi:uncharacterized membrane protein
MSLSDYLGAIGVLILAVAIFMAMGTAPTLGFIGMTMLVMAFILARHEAKYNGDSE